MTGGHGDSIACTTKATWNLLFQYNMKYIRFYTHQREGDSVSNDSDRHRGVPVCMSNSIIGRHVKVRVMEHGDWPIRHRTRLDADHIIQWSAS